MRNRLVESYDELFGGGQSDTLSGIGQFGKKWGWYQSIYALAQGDITRIEHITQLNVHKCLMALSFMKEKSDLELKKIKNRIKLEIKE